MIERTIDVIRHTQDYQGNGITAGTTEIEPTTYPCCESCKHYVTHELFGVIQGWCERLCEETNSFVPIPMEPDDFCSRGEFEKGE